MNKLPQRDDLIYKEIEEFKDYELTNCIAYEMAIRIKEVRELLNFVVLKRIVNDIEKKELQVKSNLLAVKYQLEKKSVITYYREKIKKIKNINFKKIGLEEIDLNLFYTSMEALLIKCLRKNSPKRIPRVNLLSKAENESFKTEKNKKKITQILMSVIALVGLYSFSTIFYNTTNLMLNAPEASKVDDKLKKEYEQAKKDKKDIEGNIIKYNTIGELRKTTSPFIDHVVASKPQDTKISTLEINQTAKKIVIEGFSINPNDMNTFLAKIKEHYLLDKAQITTTETKNGQNAFQIIAPINI